MRLVRDSPCASLCPRNRWNSQHNDVEVEGAGYREEQWETDIELMIKTKREKKKSMTDMGYGGEEVSGRLCSIMENGGRV